MSLQASALVDELLGEGATFLQWIKEKDVQFTRGWAAGADQAGNNPQANPRGLLYAGMGGSGISGDLLRDVLDRFGKLPLVVTKDYHKPAFVDANWLALIVSYSGNTEETINVADELEAAQVPAVAFTSGGQIASRGLITVAQQSGYQPRAAVAQVYGSMLAFVSKAGLMDGLDPDAVVASIAASQAANGPETGGPAMQIATAAVGKRIQIYATPTTAALGLYLRCQLNENSKVVADVDIVPECNHNDVTGWGGDSDAQASSIVISLSSPSDHPQTLRRLQWMQEKYESWGCQWFSMQTGDMVDAPTMVASQFGAMQVIDYISLYLAGLRGVDAGAIPEIHHLKAFLAQ